MDERQRQLIKDYGPRFAWRAQAIQNEILHLLADAASVLTDHECGVLSESMMDFIEKLQDAQSRCISRMEEIGVSYD